LRISEALGTAGQPTADQFPAIAAAGYEVVINLDAPEPDEIGAREGELVTGLGMAYVHIPVVWEAPTLADLEQFFQAMEAHAGRRLFVHCAANARVSCFVLLYRVIRQRVPLEEARETLSQIWEPNEVWEGFIDDGLAHHGLEP
jgi:protein tyrosine phosphatase (PTP) superfamily phosphohydrolase (DUF442 family)